MVSRRERSVNAKDREWFRFCKSIPKKYRPIIRKLVEANDYSQLMALIFSLYMQKAMDRMSEKIGKDWDRV